VDHLPKGELPSNAVKFKEPGSMIELNAVAVLFAVPAVILAGLIILCSYLFHEGKDLQFSFLIGFPLAFLFILPHELLHALGFGRDAVVELYVAPKQLMAFVVSTHPISKARFIFLSLFPNIVFGWLPLVIWAILPDIGTFGSVLLTFSFISIMFGCGDYMNVFNAARQMPRGSMQQLSGFNSYWFMP